MKLPSFYSSPPQFQVEVGVDSGATGRALKLTNDSILVLNDAVIEVYNGGLADVSY